MDISLRSVLTAGVTAMTASAIVIAPAVTPPPQHRFAQIALAADVRPVAPLVDDIKSLTTLVHTDQGATQRQALVGAAVGALSAGSTVMDIYNAIEPWVQYGFEVATWAVGWVPVVGIFSGQIMVAYFTVEPLVRSVVQSFAYLLDLNIGAIPGTLVNGVVSAATAFVQGEINWVLGFFPPFPPLPPLPFAATAASAQFVGPMAELAGPIVGPTVLAGPIGNAIVDASHALAGVSHAIWNTWVPIKGLIGDGVAIAGNALDWLSWVPFVPVANFELNSVWNLAAREGDALVGFANDMITAGDAFATDTVAGGGLITATNNAFGTAVNSIGTRGGQAVDAGVDFALDQLQYFTGIWIPHAAVGSPLTPPAHRDQISAALPQLITDFFAPLTPGRSVSTQKATLAHPSTPDPVTIRVNRFAERRAERAVELADGQRTAFAGTIQAQGKITRSIIKGGNDIGAAAAQGKITNPKQAAKAFGDARGKAAKGLAGSVQKVLKKLTKAGKETRKAVKDARAAEK